MFDFEVIKAEAMRQAESGYKPDNNYMMNRWDTHGAFISGAAFQYKLMEAKINLMKEDIKHLTTLLKEIEEAANQSDCFGS